MAGSYSMLVFMQTLLDDLIDPCDVLSPNMVVDYAYCSKVNTKVMIGTTSWMQLALKAELINPN